MNNKIFRDCVHGYIEVPKKYVENFIDTEIFQRLRHIEQTSMRVLYPSARHDRFTHSLGVFYLGSMAIDKLRENVVDGFLSEHNIILSEEDWLRYKRTFELACLLHDCAHSPFSHTFESYYEKSFPSDSSGEVILDKKIKEVMISDKDFQRDFLNCSPSPHEKASSIIVLEVFKQNILSLGADPNLIVRMIIGCLYQENSPNKLFENCLIQLLNSKTIDMDKLDYIIRDSWYSGFDNITIDVKRLLSALTIVVVKEKYRLAFKKNAISIIQNVIDGRNSLYLWIYNHHKVVYEYQLLQNTLIEVAKKIDENNNEDRNFLQAVFNLNTFTQKIDYKGFSFYLVNDGDVLSIFKKYAEELPCVKELLGRKHKKPIWKSFVEYNALFHSLNDEEKENLKIKVEKGDLLKSYNLKGEIDFKFVDAKPKISTITKNQIFIEIDKKGYEYTQIMNLGTSPDRLINKTFFYLFYSGKLNKDEFIQFLISNTN